MQSVKIQLRSDVPYGVFLSGGVDSSLLTAIAARNVNEKLNTFSIGFTEQSHNESEHAKVIAQHIGTNHHEFVVSVKDAIDLVETFFEVYDEPYTDTSGIPTMIVSKLASKHVKVVLSGEGGDELFFGYGTHNWAKRLNSFPFNVLRSSVRTALSLGNSRSKRVAHLLDFDKYSEFLPEHIYSQEQYLFSNREIVELVTEELKEEAMSNIAQRNEMLNQMFDKNDDCLPEERQANYELKFPFQDDLLTKVDRATMFNSIEARVPYLDNNLSEYVFSVASDIKIKDGVNKYPLKKILVGYIPEELFMRPKKGFSIPLAKWLKTDCKYLLDRYLDKGTIQQAGFVKFSVVEKLIQRFLSGEDFLYNRIWSLIVLHRWYECQQ
jgi:asparagine synthase (glutamine-hydrolysing)